jgi:hypothetical protein
MAKEDVPEQAEDLAKMLTQTVANFKTRKPSGGAT